MLQQWNYVNPPVKVTTFQTINKDLEQLFKTEDDFMYCKDIGYFIGFETFPAFVIKNFFTGCQPGV